MLKVKKLRIVLFALSFFMLFSPMLSHVLALDHPGLSGDKSADKTSAYINDVATVTIKVDGLGVPVVYPPNADIIFIIDCSTSYDPELWTLRPILTGLISNLTSLGIYNLRFGLIAFGGFHYFNPSPILTNGSADPLNTRQLSNDTVSIINFVNSLKGCGGSWEPWGDAIWLGNHWADWRSDAAKIVIFGSDEPCDQGREVPGPLDRTSGTDYDGTVLWNEVSAAQTKGIDYICINSNSSALAVSQLLRVASSTGGYCYNYTDIGMQVLLDKVNSVIAATAPHKEDIIGGYNVAVTDIVSSQVELVAGSFNVAPASQTTNPDGTITLKWNLGDMKYNDSRTLTYRVKMIECGEIPVNSVATVDYLDWQRLPASITLPKPMITVPLATVESADPSGVKKDVFTTNETVYAIGSQYAPSRTFDLYFMPDQTWTDGLSLTGTMISVTSNSSGGIDPTVIWIPPLTLGNYDIIVDVNDNGKYDQGIDAIDDNDVGTAGFEVVPITPQLSPTVESCDSSGTRKDVFDIKDTVYSNGSGYAPSTEYDLYIVNDSLWVDGTLIPNSAIHVNVTSDPSGKLQPTVIWTAPLTLGNYDIIVDVNANGRYDLSIDAIDDNDIVTAGFFVVPEYLLGTVMGLGGCFAAFGAYGLYRRRGSKRI